MVPKGARKRTSPWQRRPAGDELSRIKRNKFLFVVVVAGPGCDSAEGNSAAQQLEIINTFYIVM